MKALLAALALVVSLSAQAAIDIAGARYEVRAKVGGGDTVLNGAGLRSILFFKAYTIGLYLPRKLGSTPDVLAERGPKRLRVVAMRDVSAEQITAVIARGMKRNLDEDQYLAIFSRVEILRQIIASLGSAPQGTAIHLDWIPAASGGITRVAFNEKPVGEGIPGEDFFHALLKVWLGSEVNDESLREALLGRPTD